MGSNLPTYLPTNSSTDGAPIQSLLRVKGLCKGYVRGGLWRKRVPVAAVRGVDFEIPRGQTLALVGESGSGESTVARCVARPATPPPGQFLTRGPTSPSLSPTKL